MYSEEEFIRCTVDAFNYTKDEAKYAFKMFADGATKVPGYDIIECVDNFRQTHPIPTVKPRPPESNTSTPKNGAAMPDSKFQAPKELNAEEQEILVKKIKGHIRQKKLNFEHLFRMADPDDREEVSAITLKNTFQSMIPDIPKQDLMAFIRMLDTNKNGTIELAEYEVAMLTDKDDLQSISDNDSRLEQSRSQLGSSQKSVSNKSGLSVSGGNVLQSQVVDDKKKPVNEDEGTAEYIHSLLTQLEAKEIRPSDIFGWADSTSEGCVSSLKLIVELQQYVDMGKKELTNIVKHLDTQETGMIDKKTFESTLAANKNVHFSLSKAIGDQAATATKMSKGDEFAKPKTSEDTKKSTSLKQDIIPKITGLKGQSIKEKQPVSVLADVFKDAQQAYIKEVGERRPSVRLITRLNDAEFTESLRALKDNLRKNDVRLNAIWDTFDINEPDEGEEPKVSCIHLFNELRNKAKDFDRKKLRVILQYVDSEKTGYVTKEEFDLIFGVNPNNGLLDDSMTASVI